MKVEIIKGTLIVKAQNELESFALDCWAEKNTNPCDGHFICNEPYEALQLHPYQKKKITLFHRIKLKIQLFLYR